MSISSWFATSLGIILSLAVDRGYPNFFFGFPHIVNIVTTPAHSVFNRCTLLTHFVCLTHCSGFYLSFRPTCDPPTSAVGSIFIIKESPNAFPLNLLAISLTCCSRSHSTVLIISIAGCKIVETGSIAQLVCLYLLLFRVGCCSTRFDLFKPRWCISAFMIVLDCKAGLMFG